jgi:streptogramin lyase
MGATLAEPHLQRFPRSTLSASGAKVADRGIVIADVPCIPAMRAFAFDASGSLWVSTCGGRISRLTGADLVSSGDVTPSVNLSTVEDNGDVAFDSSGNLWVTGGTSVLRYDAARLGSSGATPANLTLTVRSNDDTRDLVPSNLAFDATGNLWVIDFGGNLLARIARSNLSGTGAQSSISDVTLALSVLALLERPAFDESGGLWLALEQNHFGRLAPAQLTLSSTAGDPTPPETIITSPSMGYANRMAFFPAAAGLPLFHHFP